MGGGGGGGGEGWERCFRARQKSYPIVWGNHIFPSGKQVAAVTCKSIYRVYITKQVK